MISGSFKLITRLNSKCIFIATAYGGVSSGYSDTYYWQSGEKRLIKPDPIEHANGNRIYSTW